LSIDRLVDIRAICFVSGTALAAGRGKTPAAGAADDNGKPRRDYQPDDQ
jgi:hypothetical protein